MTKIEDFWEDATVDDVAKIANTRKSISVTPTLEDLLAKFRGLLRDEEFKAHAGSMERYFRMVASGVIDPFLRDHNAVMAAQCVVVILEHVKNEVEQ